MKIAAIIAIVLILAMPLFLNGCKSMGGADDVCTCEVGKTGGTTWCAKCEKGYVEGEAVECESCYAAKTGGVPCPTCSVD